MTEKILLSDKAWDKLNEILEAPESPPNPNLVELLRGRKSRRQQLESMGVKIIDVPPEEVQRILDTPDGELQTPLEQSLKAVLERPQGKLH